MTVGTSLMTAYGLQRTISLTEAQLALLPDPTDLTVAYETAIAVAVNVIGEMLFIAAVICVVAIPLGLLLRGGAAELPATDSGAD